MTPRRVAIDDLPALARIWHDIWHLAHAAHLPQSVVAVRTLARFSARAPAIADQTRVMGPVGAPTGFCTIARDELYQLFVAKDAMGTGAAQILMQDAEWRLAADFETAFLHCLPENARAIAFYRRAGWQIVRNEVVALPDAPGAQKVTVTRFEKALTPRK